MFAQISKPGQDDDVESKLRDMEVADENMHTENTHFLTAFRESPAYQHVNQYIQTLNQSCCGHTMRQVKSKYQQCKSLPDVSPQVSRGIHVIFTILSILDEVEGFIKQTPAAERAKIPLSPRSEARRIAEAVNSVTPNPHTNTNTTNNTNNSTINTPPRAASPRFSPRSNTRTITHPDGTISSEETPPAAPIMTEMISRFGNPAFRTFMDQVISHSDSWGDNLWKYQHGDITEMMRRITMMTPASLASASQTSYHQHHHSEHEQHDDTCHHNNNNNTNNNANNIDPLIQLRSEMMSYLVHSFGNQRRIDYGTGHELNFLCFLVSLTRVGILPSPDTPLDLSSSPSPSPSPSLDVAPFTMGTLLVLLVFARYIQIVRMLQHHYWLEPAGSRGVWGLDDYCFLPFLFGSAQLIGHKHIRPRSVRYSEIVDEFSRDYLYLESIQFVLSVKTCSFAEHSPMLNDITGIKTWKQVNDGLLRMYHGEVLGKFAVIQHFLFTSILSFSNDQARPPIIPQPSQHPDMMKTWTTEELNHRSMPIPHAHQHRNAAGVIEIPCCSDAVRFPSALAAKHIQQ